MLEQLNDFTIEEKLSFLEFYLEKTKGEEKNHPSDIYRSFTKSVKEFKDKLQKGVTDNE
ncbi:hypothetical protein MKY91_20545 [Alkalicoccobacillus gibsonii]|uniref:Uncharacterized protein n=1 Tax=Alkalicoccobacillus gibsonii TaxID=79881 RepID=A0ABU9VQV7_9BACI